MNTKRTIAVLLLSAGTALAAGPAKRPRRRVPGGGGPGIFISAEGLRPDSSRFFAVYRGRQCVKVGRTGRKLTVPPGEYDVRVGFASGWVSRPQKVEPGKTLVVETGLFRFRDVTPAACASTVPQMLYSGETYLATGYQGQTARLYPGTYTVRYHLPGDGRSARAVRSWRVLGPLPVRWVKRVPQERAWPPEKQHPPDFTQPVKAGKQQLRWRAMPGGPDMKLHSQPMGYAAFYLAGEIDADEAGPVELTFSCRPPMKAWLNGKLIRSLPYNRRAYRPQRLTMPALLHKGRNLLLVKAAASKSGNWPLAVVAERWRTYELAIRAGANEPAGAGGPVGAKPPDSAPMPPPIPGIRGIVFCQVPNLPNGRSGLHGEQFRIVRRPRKSRICMLVPAAPDGKLTDLTSKHFVAAMQPDLSYDGRKVIFSARRTIKRDDHWNVYEMDLGPSASSAEPRQITRNCRDCLDPHYLPDLPASPGRAGQAGGRIVFSSNNVPFRDEYDRDHPPLLHTCDADGSNLERISFNLSSDTASVVLHDGRVLFTSWQHHGDHQGEAGNFCFCTIMPDGTGFNLLTGNEARIDRMSRTKSYAQQLADGRVVFVESAGHRLYNTGSLTTVHPRKPLRTRRVLTPGIVYSGHNLAGRYASPYPLPDGGMLCSYSPGRCTAPLYDNPAEDPRLGIYRFDFDSGRPGQLVFDGPACQDYDAIAIYPRDVPPVVPRLVAGDRKTGVMMCVNAYVSDRPNQDKRAVVGELPPARPGEIKAVRVVEGFGIHDTDRKKHRATVIDILQMSFGSSSNAGSNFEQKRIVGTAPVEPDGSFSVEVPADTTLSLQVLDGNGMAIETQLTWAWVRPGETRLCIGCHEDRESALSNLDCLAMRRPAHLVAPPPEQRRTVDFRRDVMPIIEKRCSRCHDGAKGDPAGGLDLRAGFELVFHRSGRRGRKLNAALFNHAYESLLQAPPNRVGTLVIPCTARHSPLIWRIYGRKLAFTDQRNPYKKQCKRMPPDAPLTDAQKKAFVEWVDLGAQWDNLPGADDLPGYDAAASRKLAVEAERLVRQPIADARRAFEVRCLECHDTRRVAAMRNMPHSKAPALVRRMIAKRKGWVHDTEAPLILEHIYKTCPKGKGK